MAAYQQHGHGGRAMSYSNTVDECFDGGRTAAMYSNNTVDECYDAGRHGHGHGHGHGRTNMYSNTTDECFDGGRTAMYSNTTDVESYDGGRNGYGGGHGGGRPAYDGACGGYGEQAGGGYYKKEEKTHKNRERVGEVGALASGAFALYEGYEAKKDPAHARRHEIEAGVAGAAALGAGGYAYHEHREQLSYGGAAKEQQHRVPSYNQYCN